MKRVPTVYIRRIQEPSLCVETWEDPGDYPSGAGAGPLPSYPYFAIDLPGEWRVNIDSLKQGMLEEAEKSVPFEVRDRIEDVSDVCRVNVSFDKETEELVLSLRRIDK